MSGEQAGYLIGNFTVTDPQLMAEYGKAAMPLVLKHGGVMTISEQRLAPLEGEASPVLVVIRFPSLGDAEAFYQSPDYTPVKDMRIKATTGGFLALVSGFAANR